MLYRVAGKPHGNRVVRASSKHMPTPENDGKSAMDSFETYKNCCSDDQKCKFTGTLIPAIALSHEGKPGLPSVADSQTEFHTIANELFGDGSGVHHLGKGGFLCRRYDCRSAESHECGT